MLKPLELSYELLFEEARLTNARAKEVDPDEYIQDLKERIRQIQATAVQEGDIKRRGLA